MVCYIALFIWNLIFIENNFILSKLCVFNFSIWKHAELNFDSAAKTAQLKNNLKGIEEEQEERNKIQVSEKYCIDNQGLGNEKYAYIFWLSTVFIKLSVKNII